MSINCLLLTDNLSSELDCSGTPTTPLQESSAAAAGIPVTPTSNPELEHIRKKRLEKLMSSDSNKSPTTPKLESADSTTSEGTTTASGTVPTSETNIASPTAKKNSTGSRFEVDSLVKVEREGKPWYGVIKWMGRIPDLSEAMFAGIQMVFMLLNFVRRHYIYTLTHDFLLLWMYIEVCK